VIFTGPSAEIVVWVIATEPKFKLAAKMIASSFFIGLSTFRNAGSSFHLRRCEIRGQQELMLCKWYVDRLTSLGSKQSSESGSHDSKSWASCLFMGEKVPNDPLISRKSTFLA